MFGVGAGPLREQRTSRTVSTQATAVVLKHAVNGEVL